jgi:glyoxylase-like metal-dependent hydrolase (beta-lactamase superfamily II)
VTARGGFIVIQIGEIEIRCVEELVIPTSVRWMLPGAPPDALERARSWLEPHFINERGHLLQSVHTFVVKTPEHTILVDTCAGNSKVRDTGGVSAFHMLDTPFLERLAEAGAAAEDVDFVVCTHFHSDHVGWNTRLAEGRWVPTFPNARYVFVEREWRHWEAEAARSEGVRTLVEDSIRPVLDAGLADLVEPDHRVSSAVWLEPSHGHTPGHVCVRIASHGADAVVTGDVMHSPIQCAYPDVKPALDQEEAPAREARRAFLERYADSGVLVLGTHFSLPAAGRIVRDGDAFRYEVVEP